jgi:hypothetical protein
MSDEHKNDDGDEEGGPNYVAPKKVALSDLVNQVRAGLALLWVVCMWRTSCAVLADLTVRSLRTPATNR